MKEYIRIRAKQCVLPLIFLSIAATAIYVLPLMTGGGAYFGSYSTQADTLVIFLYGAALIIPIWAANYKMSSRSLDVYYSLPVSKRGLLAVHFLSGFVTIIAAYTVAYVLGFFVALWRFTGANYIHYLWFYFSLIIPAYIVYSIAFFMYTRANSVADGVIFVIFSIFALSNLVSAVEQLCIIFAKKDIGISAWYFYPFIPGALTVNAFNDIFKYKSYEVYSLNVQLIASVLYTVISAAATFGLFYTEKNCKAENCGQISRNPFGYTVFVPFYLVALPVSFISYDVSVAIWSFAIVYVGGFALEAFGRRTMRIGKTRFLILVGCLVLCALLYRIAMVVQYG